jgi:glutaredoxin-like protein NrdH
MRSLSAEPLAKPQLANFRKQAIPVVHPCKNQEHHQLPTTIRVYSKPRCQPCIATYRWLDQRGIAYEVVDTSKDENIVLALKEQGYLESPVVLLEKDGVKDEWSGFNPNKLLEHFPAEEFPRTK